LSEWTRTVVEAVLCNSGSNTGTATATFSRRWAAWTHSQSTVEATQPNHAGSPLRMSSTSGLLYPVYTMKLARRAGSSSARRASSSSQLHRVNGVLLRQNAAHIG